jgi:uncharacterized membrane protein
MQMTLSTPLSLQENLLAAVVVLLAINLALYEMFNQVPQCARKADLRKA